MSFIKLANQVKTSISLNQTEEALVLLRDHINHQEFGNTLLLRIAQQYGLNQELLKGTIDWQTANVARNNIHAALLEIVDQLSKQEIKDTTVFISYNRESFSLQLAKHLHDHIESEGFNAFMDAEDIPLGADWVYTIFDALKSSKYMILLLSEAANHSEMVIKEVEEAHRLKKQTGHPIILPVRVNFPMEMGLNAKLHSMLHRIQQLEWNDNSDTAAIVEQIMDILYLRKELLSEMPSNEAIKVFKERDSFPPTPVAPLEVPRGAVRTDSKYYVKRLYEQEFIKSVEFPGALLRIRGPRQYGKTSMLTRVVGQAAELDYTIIAFDFQEIDEETISDLDTLLWEFCNFFAEELDLEEELDKRWKKPRAKKQIATSFIEKEILRKHDKPILLAMDEADRLFTHHSVSNEFFQLLRSWHEKSKVPNKREWEKFRICLSYSTEAKLAIQDLNASPFNVGQEAKLAPFTKAQVKDLVQRHGLSWTADQLDTIMRLLGGQPYLVRRALYILAKEELQFDEFLEKADKHNGPFSDHLRHHLVNIKQFQDCANAMITIIEKNKCNDPMLVTRLEATGLIVGSPPDIYPSNELYSAYFRGKL